MNNKEKDNNEIRENVLNLSKLFLGEDFVNENIDEINDIIDSCINEYDEEDKHNECSDKKCNKKEIVDTAVNTMKREQEDNGNEDFCDRVTVKQSRQIHKIVSEYVDTVIKPRVSKLSSCYNNDDMVDSVYDALYEFACWMLLK